MAAITYDPVHGKYNWNGNSYSSQAEAEAASNPSAPSNAAGSPTNYNPQTQTYNPFPTAIQPNTGYSAIAPPAQGALSGLQAAAGQRTNLGGVSGAAMPPQPDLSALSAAESARNAAATQEAATRTQQQSQQQQQEQAAQAERMRQEQLAREAEARRLSQIQQLTGGGAQAPVTMGGGSAAGGGQAAREAAYARAKDIVGKQQRASLMALKDVAGEQGTYVAGGDNPALLSAESNLLANGANKMGDFNRQQLLSDLEAAKHAEDLAARQREVEYQGAIQQRGQNMGQLPSLIGLLTARSLY